jgi:hypothetical protein
MLDFVTVPCFHDFALMYINTSVWRRVWCLTPYWLTWLHLITFIFLNYLPVSRCLCRVCVCES